MELKDLKKEDLFELARKVKRSPEHLIKIGKGQRPCPAQLALAIQKATNGFININPMTFWEKEKEKHET